MPVGTGGLSFPRLVCSINRPDLPRINASIFVAALICSAVGDMPIVEVRAARSGASGTGGLSFSLLASSFSRPDLPRITASIFVAASICSAVAAERTTAVLQGLGSGDALGVPLAELGRGSLSCSLLWPFSIAEVWADRILRLDLAR